LPALGSSIALGLHAKLQEQGIDVSTSTFELMVDACLHASDLTTASSFLVSMESGGHAPGNDVLDRVMDFLHRRTQEGKEAEADAGKVEKALESSAAATAPASGAAPVADASRNGWEASSAPGATGPSGSGAPPNTEEASGSWAAQPASHGVLPLNSQMGYGGLGSAPGGAVAGGCPAPAGFRGPGGCGPCGCGAMEGPGMGGMPMRRPPGPPPLPADMVPPAQPVGFHGGPGYDYQSADPSMMMVDMSNGGVDAGMRWLPMQPIRPQGIATGAIGGALGGAGYGRRQRGRALPGQDKLPAFCVPDEFASEQARGAKEAAGEWPDGEGAADKAGVQEGEGGAAGSSAKPQIPEGPPVCYLDENGKPLMTLDSLMGHWYRNGDSAHCWTIKDNGGSYFNGRYAGITYDLRQEVDTGEIWAEAHRMNGERLDLSKSSSESLVWIFVSDGSYCASWTRAPETAEVPTGTVLNADAAEFVPSFSMPSTPAVQVPAPPLQLSPAELAPTEPVLDATANTMPQHAGECATTALTGSKEGD